MFPMDSKGEFEVGIYGSRQAADDAEEIIRIVLWIASYPSG